MQYVPDVTCQGCVKLSVIYYQTIIDLYAINARSIVLPGDAVRFQRLSKLYDKCSRKYCMLKIVIHFMHFKVSNVLVRLPNDDASMLYYAGEIIVCS